MPSKKDLKIVSFDDGGIRGLSQLQIMRTIMHRLSWDSECDESTEEMLPCEHFDLMGGSGTGGLIVVLLAKLRMSVEEASKEFCKIMEQVYNPDNLSPSERSGRLRKCMEDAMERKGLDIDLPFTDKKRSGLRSVFLIASPRTNAKSTLCLRTYPVRSQPSSTITVIEAVLATCAIQPEFCPVTSGSDFNLREYITAGRAANPIRDAITEAHLRYGGDSSVACLLSLGTGCLGITNLPSTGDESALYRTMRDMMHDCEQKAQEIGQRISQVEIYSRFSVEQGMQNKYSGKSEDISWIATQTEEYLNRPETCEKLDRFEQHFRQTGDVTLERLKHAGGPAVSGQLTAAVERSLGILTSNQDGTIIAKLKPADLDCNSHTTECMEGTRQDILRQIDLWAANLDGPNIMWLHGHPGVGKSAIASSLVEKWRSTGRLGSSFFFRRERANVMSPNALWRTVAYDLGRRYPTIQRHLVASLKTNDTLPSTSNIDSLFRQLIHEPLVASEASGVEGLPIIIVDALDECGGADGRHSHHRKSLMRTLKSWSILPGKFKLLVSSRDESDIKQLFSTTIHQSLEVPAGRKVDSSSSMDIRAFLKQELPQIASQYQLLPSDWPGDEIIGRLVDRAAGLFIWVKTVIKILERGEPLRTLKQILDGSGTGGMADLYTWILNTSFPNPSHSEVQDFHSVLGAIIFSNAPLDASSLARLLSIEITTMDYIRNGLHSLIESGNTLRICHQSFVDFLLDPKECPAHFLISRECGNQNLAVACLRVMNRCLRFNICDLDSSYSRNSDVPDLASRIEKNIPNYLFYSSRFWADYLAQTEFNCQLFEQLQYFAQNQFLFWLEVLSLTGIVNVASGMLLVLVHWIRASHQDDALVADMQKFVAGFASVISQSAPHIYLSALPFAPQSMEVSRRYLGQYPQTLIVRRGQSQWPAIQHVLTGHDNSVNSVAFSPDGKNIVSSSYDMTIRVWDAETGETVVGPLRGHIGYVFSVSFSPDGRRIVSGSGDKTIRVWDAETGETVLGPLEGHLGLVLSVSFSPDGRRIVSGSGDKTIRVWDAETGEKVAGPLSGHDGQVFSVSFSQDGSRIVSSSGDKTVRVWDAEAGEMVVGVLEGHYGSVFSASFSPDGRRIVSSSDDTTVRVWDAKTGETVVGPLEGHSDWVRSASFSPDGRRIVSSSDDNTIRVWDAETGNTVVGPLRGHSGRVRSASFSPDGRRIVSSSDDDTVRLWDAEAGATVVELLKGHTDWVTSAQFSPDGRRIASSSDDKTVRIWDAETGETVLGPLKGHGGSVLSAPFSPDGRRVVSSSNDETIRVWDAETGRMVVGPLEGHLGLVLSVSFSPDGRRIVSGSGDHTILIWDAETGEIVLGPLEGHSGWVRSVSFSPDCRHVLSISDDSTVRLWSAGVEETVSGSLEGHNDWVKIPSFLPDDRSSCDDKIIRVWDAETGEPMFVPLEEHSGWVFPTSSPPNDSQGSEDESQQEWESVSLPSVVRVGNSPSKFTRSVAFSPDGTHIISSSGDWTIRAWDVESCKTVLGPLKGHSDWVTSLSPSPDGSLIASSSADKTIRVWDAKSGETVLGPWKAHNDWVTSVSFSPDGRQIVSGSGDKTVRVWDAVGNKTKGHIYSRLQHTPWTNNDGWMLGPNSEILFWVPPEIRPRLCPLRNTLVLGGNPVQLDLTHFVHGEEWSRCKYRPV